MDSFVAFLSFCCADNSVNAVLSCASFFVFFFGEQLIIFTYIVFTDLKKKTSVGKYIEVLKHLMNTVALTLLRFLLDVCSSTGTLFGRLRQGSRPEVILLQTPCVFDRLDFCWMSLPVWSLDCDVSSCP